VTQVGIGEVLRIMIAIVFVVGMIETKTENEQVAETTAESAKILGIVEEVEMPIGILARVATRNFITMMVRIGTTIDMKGVVAMTTIGRTTSAITLRIETAPIHIITRKTAIAMENVDECLTWTKLI
jgi:hypothetical protein